MFDLCYCCLKETEYYNKIKNPMDFSKIRPKLEQHEYETMHAFLHDIRLIFNNCKKYNKVSISFLISVLKNMINYKVELFQK